MRLALVLIALLSASAVAAQTLLGNCGGTVWVQITSGNVYCYPAPVSGCGKMDFSRACNSMYIGAF